MTETAEDYELFHYGVKGMKWGVRRDRDRVTAASPSAKRDYSDLSKKEQRKAGKVLRRNRVKIYNEAAQYMNDGAIDRINKKYAGVELLNTKGEYNKAGKKYLAEYTDTFETKISEIGARVVNEKTKGRINMNPGS